MAQSPACKHEHTQLIAKDDEAEYIECVDCGAILETHELAETPKSVNPKSNLPESVKSNPAGPEPGTSNPFDESLSDA